MESNSESAEAQSARGAATTAGLSRRRFLGQLAMLSGGVATFSLLSACQQTAPVAQIAPTSTAARVNATAATAPAATSQAATPVAASAPAQSDARVVVAQESDVTTLDPNSDTVVTNRNVQMNMFDALIERDHSMHFKPGLALSWQAVDPTTWQFKLRQGVKFHDGTPFTAKDVKYTIDRIKGTDLGSKMTIYVDAISDASIVDDYTVVIKTKAPYPLMETRLSAVPIVSQAVVEKLGLAEFARKPVGTGPFKFLDWQKDQQVTMERYEDHWRGKAGIKTLVFRPLAEPGVRVSEILTGGIDVAVRPPVDSLDQLKQAGVAVKGVPSVRLLHGVMDMSKKPFDDRRVRQAINYAVDVDGMIKSLLGGHAFRATQAVDPVTFGYSPDIQPYPYDVARAKQLLSEAGLSGGFEVPLETPTTYKQYAEVISQQLAQIGIKATIVTDEPSVQIRKVTDKKVEPFYLFGWGSSTFDADGTTFSLFRSGQLYSNTNIPELDKLVDQAHSSVDQAQRQTLYKQAHELMREEAPVLFLWELEDLYGVRSKLNWEPRADELLWFYDATVS